MENATKRVNQRRSKEEKLLILQRYEASGLRVRDYCREAGIHESVFYIWRKRLLPESNENGNIFNKIDLSNSIGSGVELELPGGICLRMESMPSVPYLVELSTRLRGLC